MSTYSTSLRLELIANGAQVGNWGDTTNNNLGTLLEQAITGVTTISMLDVDYTLSNLNGSSDEARNAVIIVGGTNTAIRNVIVPSANKLYTITNNTTGGFSIIIKTLAGTGVTIPNGMTTLVFCNGINVYTGLTGTLGNFTAGGTVTGTTFYGAGTGLTGTAAGLSIGGSAGSAAATAYSVTFNNGGAGDASGTTFNGSAAKTISYNSVGAAPTIGSTSITTLGTIATGTWQATTIGVSYGGTGVTTSTGSGSNVLNTSPTLVTPLLGTPTSGTLTNCTGLPLTTGITGTLAVANGGTGVTSSTGTGSVVLSASPTFTGTPLAPTAAAGTNTTQIATTAFVLANGLPSGSIVIWSGSAASIPSGWYLCDGLNSTPDLRNKFVVGAGSTYAVGATGGSADAIIVSHTHTATSTVTDPGHFHTVFANPGGSSGAFGGGSSGSATNINTDTKTTGITVATSVSTTGSSGTNANLPPYYALCYIMKA